MAYVFNNPSSSLGIKDKPTVSDKTKEWEDLVKKYLENADNSTYTPSQETTDAGNKYHNALDEVSEMTFNPSDKTIKFGDEAKTATDALDDIIFSLSDDTKNAGQSYQDALDKLKNLNFQKSAETQKAYQTYVEGQKNKPGEFKYDDSALKSLYDKILNREDFSFDLNNSALYQQYKERYQTLGQQAMMDTMGQASALSGGYGSSYAASAGQQAYQNYIRGLSDIVPSLYRQALNTYQMEGNQLLDRYTVAASERENAQNMYQNNFNNWLGTQQLNLDAYSTLFGQDMDIYKSDMSKASEIAQLLGSDYWNGVDLDKFLFQSDLDKQKFISSQAWENYWNSANFDLSAFNSNADIAEFIASQLGEDYRFTSDRDYQIFADTIQKYLELGNTYGGLYTNGLTNDTQIWEANNDNRFKAAAYDMEGQINADNSARAWYNLTHSGGGSSGGSKGSSKGGSKGGSGTPDFSKVTPDATKLPNKAKNKNGQVKSSNSDISSWGRMLGDELRKNNYLTPSGITSEGLDYLADRLADLIEQGRISPEQAKYVIDNASSIFVYNNGR